ncbi:NIPSNAP family protein [Lysobacter sp. 5GHs7-4]|uniref:NIPSNAP family protein n=1 Tax=Lysobacter sp. 5GHs7-4 TaxID=2904253 RepID=UPI001E64E696|nr:NIPSNAP family protein [Lysobacter sp. 5GHs7-4]UHQ22483.1 NIPSNAP family protein [Lysobacter sp. 5GHs7-4]
MQAASPPYRCLLALALLTGALAPPPARAETETAGAATPIHQLRIYRVHAGNEGPFHDRFRDHALRIMARHRFDVVATWQAKSDAGTEFVYLLQWPDAAAMKSAWDAFMADPEWAAIKKETGARHGRFVDGIQDRTLQLTDYSPQRGLAD